MASKHSLQKEGVLPFKKFLEDNPEESASRFSKANLGKMAPQNVSRRRQTIKAKQNRKMFSLL